MTNHASGARTFCPRTLAVVVTVLNEQHTVVALIAALSAQTLLPHEVVLVDGGSSDETVSVLHQLSTQKLPFTLTVIKKPGNRSVGRNTAIQATLCEWIAVTDAGCEPLPDWLEQLVVCQQNSGSQVVAGYYTAIPENPLQEAIIPYVLVRPDRIDPDSFLPATRSMLMHRSAWKAAGTFNTQLSDNEDYAFAHELRKIGKIAFTRRAVVRWYPVESLTAFIWMVYRFARGDVFASLLRPKVVLIFARYAFLALLLLLIAGVAGVRESVVVAVVAGLLYAIWAVGKNIRVVQRGWYWLPVLQVCSDVAVLVGSLDGAIRRLSVSTQDN